MTLASVGIALSLLLPGSQPVRQDMTKCRGYQFIGIYTDGSIVVDEWKTCRQSRAIRRR